MRSLLGRRGLSKHMRQPESLAGAGVTSSGPERAGVASARLPSVPGILTAGQVLATGKSIAAMQQRDGAIGWPDGHVDAWNHVECLMALSVCGLRGAARRGYEWLRATQAEHTYRVQAEAFDDLAATCERLRAVKANPSFH